jgi:hypothetical protein
MIWDLQPTHKSIKVAGMELHLMPRINLDEAESSVTTSKAALSIATTMKEASMPYGSDFGTVNHPVYLQKEAD